MTTMTLEPAPEPTTGPATRILFFTNPDWAPCQEMRRILHSSVGDELRVEEIDIWDAAERAVEHELLSVPTLIVLEQETEIGRVAGLAGRRRLTKQLHRILRSSARPGSPLAAATPHVNTHVEAQERT